MNPRPLFLAALLLLTATAPAADPIPRNPAHRDTPGTLAGHPVGSRESSAALQAMRDSLVATGHGTADELRQTVAVRVVEVYHRWNPERAGGFAYTPEAGGEIAFRGPVARRLREHAESDPAFRADMLARGTLVATPLGDRPRYVREVGGRLWTLRESDGMYVSPKPHTGADPYSDGTLGDRDVQCDEEDD